MKDQTKINNYLNSRKFNQIFKEQFSTLKLTDQELIEIKKIISDLLAGHIYENELAAQIKKRLPNTAAGSKDIRNILLVIYYGVIPEELKQDVKVFSKTEDTVTDNIDDFIKELKFELQLKIEKHYQRRFESIIFNWIRGIRDDSETIETLTRNKKIGGLGLSQKSAEQTVELLKQKKDDYKKQGTDLSQLLTEQLEQKQPQFQGEEPEDQEIDVQAKPELKQTPKSAITGQDITIDQLLNDQPEPNQPESSAEIKKNQPSNAGVIKNPQPASPPTAKNPAASKSAQQDNSIRNILHDKLEEITEELAQNQNPSHDSEFDSGLAQKIEQHEDLLEDNPELAPPAPAVRPTTDNPQPTANDQQLPAAQTPAIRLKTENQKPKTSQQEAPKVPVQPKIKQPLFKQDKDQEPGRPKMDDVKFTPRVYGPVEELQALTIKDFRRLSKDPQEAADKIYSKIDLLEQESYQLKSAGIKALKKSPLYKVYAQIMSEAISQGRPIDDIIKQTKNISQPEFQAITELNRLIS